MYEAQTYAPELYDAVVHVLASRATISRGLTELFDRGMTSRGGVPTTFGTLVCEAGLRAKYASVETRA